MNTATQKQTSEPIDLKPLLRNDPFSKTADVLYTYVLGPVFGVIDRVVDAIMSKHFDKEVTAIEAEEKKHEEEAEMVGID